MSEPFDQALDALRAELKAEIEHVACRVEELADIVLDDRPDEKLESIERLAGQYEDETDAEELAAFRDAVWEILYPTAEGEKRLALINAFLGSRVR